MNSEASDPQSADVGLAQQAADLIDARSYFRQMSVDTTLKSLFGRINPAALAEGRLEVLRKGTLTEAEIVIFDEVFNTLGDVLTGLNLALNEREYVEEGSGSVHKLPVMACWAATNRLPDISRPEVEAHYDRYIFRFNVEDPDASALKRIIDVESSPSSPAPLDKADLMQMRSSSEMVLWNLSDVAVDVSDSLALKGIRVSPRRWREIKRAARGLAFVRGFNEVRPKDLSWVVQHSTWSQPDERQVVQDAVHDVFGAPLDVNMVDAEMKLAINHLEARIQDYKNKVMDKDELRGSARGTLNRIKATAENFCTLSMDEEDREILVQLEETYKALALNMLQELKKEEAR